MKKNIIKILILIIIGLICAVVSSFAINTLTVEFESIQNVDAGETVEIPVYINDIRIDELEEGMIGVKFKIKYDKDVFELVEYSVDSNGKKYYFNKENSDFSVTENLEDDNIIVCSLNSSFFTSQTSNEDDIRNSLIEFTKIGTLKFKAKDDVKSGAYYIGTEDVEAGNDVANFSGKGSIIPIYVTAKEENDSDIFDIINNSETDSFNTTEETYILDIRASEDGTKVYITPDEVNGVKVGKIVAEDSELIKENDAFVFVPTESRMYSLNVYDENGVFLGTEVLKAIINDEDKQEVIQYYDYDPRKEPKVVEEDNQNDNQQQNDDSNNNSNNENDSNNQNSNNNSGNSNIENTTDTDDKTNEEVEKNNDKNTTNNSNNQTNETVIQLSNNNTKKSPQTGDYIIYAIGTIAAIIMIWGIVMIVKCYNTK